MTDELLDTAIAIVGLAGRFPGAEDAGAFWRNLRSGVESVRALGDDELAWAGVHPDRSRRANFVARGAPIDHLDCFAAGFFGFSPREARLLDPQHRHFLECAWSALEHAGYAPGSFDGRVGVYGGVGNSQYQLNNLMPLFLDDSISGAELFQAAIANGKDSFAPRVSYKLDLKGPGLTIQTACSSSLVAVHIACEQLFGVECDMALAGGVSFTGHVGYLYEQGGILSPDGHCRPFDAKAEGTVGGSGVGVVVLRRLRDAVAAGDTIHAIIRGSAINNDGADKVGFTAPSVSGQTAVIAEALSVAGVSPETIGYIEAHGTGTRLGDPIEVSALARAFRLHTSERQFCALGSVKSNIGHLDAASGIAGLIKAVFAVEHGEIPPTLHFEAPNPELGLEESPFFVAAALRSWPSSSGPRRAGVSSFGIGGTNAHLLLEQAPPATESGPGRAWQIACVSARTKEAVDRAAENLAGHLDGGEAGLADTAFTLHVGRRSFPHRRFVVCRDRHEAAAALRARDPQDAGYADPTPGQEPRVVFMFPGAGAQHGGMGAQIYRSEPSFRADIDACMDLLAGAGLGCGHPFRDGGDRQDMDLPSRAFPAIFAIEYALARLWMRWGIEPAAFIGHSLGEYVAACLAGVLRLEDAASMVALRARLFERTEPGAMLGVALSAEELTPLLQPPLAIAAVNAPAQCVVSGPPDAVAALAATLETRQVETRTVRLAYAAHSALLDPILGEFEAGIAHVRSAAPKVPYLSNLSGTWLGIGDEIPPSYWVRHMRETVRFSDGIQTLLDEPRNILVEVGPGRGLQSLVRKHLEAKMQAQAGAAVAERVISSLPHPADPTPEMAGLLHAVGALWSRGGAIDWPRFYEGQERRRVPLPTYPFETEWERYWVAPDTSRRAGARSSSPATTGTTLRVPRWQHRPWPDASVLGACDQHRWLVFTDEGALGDAIVDRLAARGAEHVLVSPGDAFANAGPGQYSVRPSHLSDSMDLLLALAGRGPVPERWLYLWHLAPGARSAQQPLERPGAALVNMLRLLRAVALEAPSRRIQLDVVLTQGCDVSGAETVDRDHRIARGLCRVLDRELYKVRCRTIDIPDALPGAGMDAIAERVLADAVLPAGSPLAAEHIAYRGRRRWVERVESLPVSAAPPPEGRYLVTGQLFGELGMSFLSALSHALAPSSTISLVAPEAAIGPEPADARLGFDLEAESDSLAAEYRDASRAFASGQVEDTAGLESALNQLCAAHAAAYLEKSGIAMEPGAWYEKTELQQRLGIIPKFEKLYRALLMSLADAGVLGEDGQRVTVLRRAPDVAESQRQAVARFPDFRPTFELLAHCVAHYPEALTGKIDAHSVLYPGGDYDFLVRHTPAASNDRACQDFIAGLVANIAARRRDRPLRILEVGGGTGLLTWPIARALRDANVTYTFTDIGKKFVLDARKAAARGGYAFLRSRVLDVSAEPIPQGLSPRSYDLILAYNVLHATPSLRATIGHLQELMAPDALLVQVQTRGNRHYNNLIFGLAEGWWHFDDAPLRTAGPFLDVPSWLALLREQGFAARALPEPSDAPKVVLLAQQRGGVSSDGRSAQAWMSKLTHLEARTGVGFAVESASNARNGHDSQVLEQARCRIHIVDPSEPAPLAELDPETALIEAGALASAALDASGAPAEKPARPGLIVSPGMPAHAHGPVAGALPGIAIDAWLETRPSHAGAVAWSHLRWHPVPGHEVSTLRAALAAAGDEPIFELHAPPAADMGGAGHAERPREAAAYGPAQSAGDAESVTPQSSVEARIAELWCDVLGLPNVGMSDNFFQLGGDSLIALQLQARLRNAFAVEVGVEALFERPTVAQLARWVCEQQESAQATIAPREPDAAPATRAGSDEPEDVASLIERIAELSDAEAEALLAEVSSSGNGDPS